jgi:hypothetical protein
MILPPDTEKEQEALEDLLASPPAARLPPPPYGYGNSLHRASTSSIPYRYQPSVVSVSSLISAGSSSSAVERRASSSQWTAGVAARRHRLGLETGDGRTYDETERGAPNDREGIDEPTSPMSTAGSADRLRVLEKDPRMFPSSSSKRRTLRWSLLGLRRPKWRGLSKRTWITIVVVALVRTIAKCRGPCRRF